MGNKYESADELFEQLKDTLRVGEKFCEVMQVYLSDGFVSNQVAADAFDEIFMESLSDQIKNCVRFIGREIEHLLKITYCDSEQTLEENKKEWESKVELHRENAGNILNWGPDPDSNVLRGVNPKLQKAHDLGIYFYSVAMKKHSDLRINYDKIPKKCPWALEELMDDDINELLSKLSK